MRYLFIHQNFPSQYAHIVRHLAAKSSNEVIFISEPNGQTIAGVRRATYRMPRRPPADIHPSAVWYEVCARRADAVASVGTALRQEGFTPDIIIGHHGWGELLTIVDVWPGVPVLGYFEFYYRTAGQDVGFDPEFPVPENDFPRIRAMNLVNLQAMALDQFGQTPTRWQLSRFPNWAQDQTEILPEGVDLDVCAPSQAVSVAPFLLRGFRVERDVKLVTYVSRNLEPYRCFHVMMRALPRLLSRPDVKVVILGGDAISYSQPSPSGSWREHFLRELAGRYDVSRVWMPGRLAYADYIRLLQRSDVHVYLTYPFVASWSLREALACGCAIVGADVPPVTEFIEHGVNGLLVPALDHERVARQVLDLLGTPSLKRSIARAARQRAERDLGLPLHLSAFESRIATLTGTALSRVS